MILISLSLTYGFVATCTHSNIWSVVRVEKKPKCNIYVLRQWNVWFYDNISREVEMDHNTIWLHNYFVRTIYNINFIYIYMNKVALLACIR